MSLFVQDDDELFGEEGEIAEESLTKSDETTVNLTATTTTPLPKKSVTRPSVTPTPTMTGTTVAVSLSPSLATATPAAHSSLIGTSDGKIQSPPKNSSQITEPRIESSIYSRSDSNSSGSGGGSGHDGKNSSRDNNSDHSIGNRSSSSGIISSDSNSGGSNSRSISSSNNSNSVNGDTVSDGSGSSNRNSNSSDVSSSDSISSVKHESSGDGSRVGSGDHGPAVEHKANDEQQQQQQQQSKDDDLSSLSDLEEKEDNNPLPRPKGLHPSTPIHAVVIIGPPGVYLDECTMICAEFAFSHVSVSNAPQVEEDDSGIIRSLSGISPAVACRSISAQVTRCIAGIKGQTEYRSKRLVVISGFPADLRALQLFTLKFPWIEIKAIVYFHASDAVFIERIKGSKDFHSNLDDVNILLSDHQSSVLPLLQFARNQGKLYSVEDNGQVGDVFARVRGCILAVVVDHLSVIAKNTTTGIAQSKAKILDDFKRYQHEPVASRKEDTERFLEGLQRERELRMVETKKRKIAEEEEARVLKEKKQKELEEEKQLKKAKEAQMALVKRQEEVEKAARLKMQQRGNQSSDGRGGQNLFTSITNNLHASAISLPLFSQQQHPASPASQQHPASPASQQHSYNHQLSSPRLSFPHQQPSSQPSFSFQQQMSALSAYAQLSALAFAHQQSSQSAYTSSPRGSYTHSSSSTPSSRDTFGSRNTYNRDQPSFQSRESRPSSSFSSSSSRDSFSPSSSSSSSKRPAEEWRTETSKRSQDSLSKLSWSLEKS